MQDWATLSPFQHEFIRKNSRPVFYGPFSLRKVKKAPFLGFAVVVPVKVSKKAVIRNNIRRRVKAIFTENKPFLEKSPFIVFVKEDITELSPDELKKAVISLFKKAYIL